ncbi:Uncharacterised protein [uncultured archaeon]|nr:Uncharacterised protein [uncultured archaeon]
MITEKQIPAMKQKKMAKVWRATKRVAKNAFFTALIVGGLAAGESAIAQNIDTSKVEKPEIQLSLKKMPVKPYLNLKGFGTLYDGGKTTGVGLGMETGVSVGKYTVGSTGSIVNQGDKVKLEEASVFVVVPIGKTTVVGYSYMDRFLRQTVPAYGLNVKGFGVKVGAEISPYKDADGCWVGYVKVPVGSVVLGAGLAGWNDAGGFNGGIKKYVLTLNTSHELGKGVTLNTELLYGKLVEVGTPGYLNFRMTVTKGF